MPLVSPNLDDRTFEELVTEARRRIQQLSPEWTDLSPNDPGIVLLELFAFLTETMIYRLNRLPEKAYIEFLRLMGVRLHPPAAAAVTLRFERARPDPQPLEIPRGTRVTVNRPGGEPPPLFITDRAVVIPAGETGVQVVAHHCELVEGELVGIGTGLAGHAVQARRPPLIAPTGSVLDLMVGVEAREEELEERAPAIQHEAKVYRIWREVDNFTHLGDDPHVYVADRMMGLITFAPAARLTREDGTLSSQPRALGAIPPAGHEIRLWYRRGGGPAGNVAANTLELLKDSIPGVSVTNPEPATGGQAMESLENALIRGPQELHSLQRAVTARDFELVALYSSRAVSRARAITQAEVWAHATPGSVEVLLVPHLPEEERGRVTASALREVETAAIREGIASSLAERRPAGIFTRVNWANYKTVRVEARIVVRRQADQVMIRQRVLERLHAVINPLPTRYSTSGWPFGQALRASHVYDMALAEPGVLWVDHVRLLVEEVPDRAVTTIAVDAFQRDTWYVASGARLFRSLNGGDGWEMARDFSAEPVVRVRAHADRAGWLAVATRLPAEQGSRVYLSPDSGESWHETPYTTAFEIEDIEWTTRDGEPLLLLATSRGLYELAPGGSPVQILVDPQEQGRGFYAVTVSRGIRGDVSVAVAAQATGGIYLSSQGARPNSFRMIGQQGKDIRVLAVQSDGPRSFLWAGAAAAGPEDTGQGCFRWELRGDETPPEGWRAMNTGWVGGSCRSLTFLGGMAFAATHRAGVLRVALGESSPRWVAPDVRCGLPLRDPSRFQPVDTVTADAERGRIMAGGEEGVFRSTDEGTRWEATSARVFTSTVTLPPTWLFCSGEHAITVVSEDEAERD
jgi:hypothetical protein